VGKHWLQWWCLQQSSGAWTLPSPTVMGVGGSIFTNVRASPTRLRDQLVDHLRRRRRPPSPCLGQPPLASSRHGTSLESSTKPLSLTTLQRSEAMASSRPSPSGPRPPLILNQLLLWVKSVMEVSIVVYLDQENIAGAFLCNCFRDNYVKNPKHNCFRDN
jgi:hypothetical protein